MDRMDGPEKGEKASETRFLDKFTRAEGGFASEPYLGKGAIACVTLLRCSSDSDRLRRFNSGWMLKTR
jgi:hypothetical protein